MYQPTDILPLVKKFHNYKSIWVGFSGGLDSHVLLHSLVALRDSGSIVNDISVLHVNHQLSADAKAWQEHCQVVCTELDVYFNVKCISINESGASLENKARDLRYAAFASSVGENDCLCLGHHANDQIETVLFRLIRGTGISGLSGIPRKRALGNTNIYRPLLNITKAELSAYAMENNLKWIEDSSNANDAFTRNYLRNNIVNKLMMKWPNLPGSIQRLSQHADESNTLLADLAELDLAKCSIDKHTFDFGYYQSLSILRQKNLLRHHITKLGYQVPSTKQLTQILQKLLTNKKYAIVLIAAEYTIRLFNQKVYFVSKLASLPANQLSFSVQEPLPIATLGTLVATKTYGRGINLPNNANMMVTFRSNTKLLLSNGQHTSLKKFFNAYRVPPWLRDRIPFLYYQGELLVIVGYYANPRYQVQHNQEGWQFTLE